MKTASAALAFGLAFTATAARAQTDHTSLAGEAVHTTVLGLKIDVPERDRRKMTVLNVGAVTVFHGPEDASFNLLGGLYLWREGNGARLRAVISGLVNTVRYDRAFGTNGFGAVLTLDTSTLLDERSEYVEGVRLSEEELNTYRVWAGLGVGYRRRIAPGNTENTLEASLTYEPGYLAFRRGDATSPAFVRPRNTYEGRLHLRFRADALQRNILELPLSGYAFGSDLVFGRRARWHDWGGPVTGPQDGGAGRSFTAVSFYGVGAAELGDRRLRLVGDLHCGGGSDLDRFSAFRLGGGAWYGETETLSFLVLPGAGADEIDSRRYLLAGAELRYEALFFLFLHLKGTLAWADRLRFEDGAVATRRDPMHAVTVGLSTGLPWKLSLKLGFSRNFGLYRERDGRRVKGSSGLVVSINRLL